MSQLRTGTVKNQGSTTVDNVTLDTNGSTRFGLDSGGTGNPVLFVDVSNNSVGINHATPSNGLSISGNVDITGAITVTGFVGNTTFGSDVTVNGDLNVLQGLVVDTNTLIVDSTNNRVGIGTANPQAKLDVNGNSILQGLIHTQGGLLVAPTNKTVSVVKVLPGNTSIPKIQIASVNNDAHYSAIRHAATASSPAYLSLSRARGTLASGGEIVQENDRLGKIIFHGHDGEDFEIAAAITSDVIGTPEQDDIRANISFWTSENNIERRRMLISSSGNVGIGTANPQAKLDVNGNLKCGGTLIFTGATKGVKFGDGSAGIDSKTLDDYEEGTWTPVYLATGGSAVQPTGVYTLQTGRYTKIGDVVTCTCRLRFNAGTKGSGFLNIGNLPFTEKNVSNRASISVGSVLQWNASSTGLGAPTGGVVINNDTRVALTTVFGTSLDGGMTGNCTMAVLTQGDGVDTSSGINEIEASFTYLAQ